MFDVLSGAEHPLSAEEISEAVGASLDGTQRLLAACTGLQLLKTHQDDGRGQHTHDHTHEDLFKAVTVQGLKSTMMFVTCALKH